LQAIAQYLVNLNVWQHNLLVLLGRRFKWPGALGARCRCGRGVAAGMRTLPQRDVCTRALPQRDVCTRTLPQRDVCTRALPQRDVCMRTLLLARSCFKTPGMVVGLSPRPPSPPSLLPPGDRSEPPLPCRMGSAPQLRPQPLGVGGLQHLCHRLLICHQHDYALLQQPGGHCGG
jgi:hypothetical protein